MIVQVYKKRSDRKRKKPFKLLFGSKLLKLNKLLNSLIIFSLALMLFLGGIAAFYYFEVSPVSTFSTKNSYSFSNFIKWQDFLFKGIPLLEFSKEQHSNDSVKSYLSNPIDELVNFLINTDIKNKYYVFEKELPLFASLVKVDDLNSGKILPVNKNVYNGPDPANLVQRERLSDKVLVGIYHTHTAESFVPSSNVTHKPGGQLGDIVDVGESLLNALDKEGILSVQSRNIHDYPSFMKAYAVSEITAQKMIADNPHIKVIIDIHRDAGKRKDNIVDINKKTAAKISFVVAEGQEDLLQPLFKENLAFVKKINSKINKLYPNLSKGIQITPWRYNQHLHPHAILIEVGCQENSKEEAVYSIQLFAKALSEVLREGENN
ncbi:stage II sporulation protein P [Selenomonadales bacterium OttesenSCG-928-I06]|nr:stage II sporulation protein P [Selenomonadales bacterium OttesenSCG-928-I06]